MVMRQVFRVRSRLFTATFATSFSWLRRAKVWVLSARTAIANPIADSGAPTARCAEPLRPRPPARWPAPRSRSRTPITVTAMGAAIQYQLTDCRNTISLPAMRNVNAEPRFAYPCLAIVVKMRRMGRFLATLPLSR